MELTLELGLDFQPVKKLSKKEKAQELLDFLFQINNPSIQPEVNEGEKWYKENTVTFFEYNEINGREAAIKVGREIETKLKSIPKKEITIERLDSFFNHFAKDYWTYQDIILKYSLYSPMPPLEKIEQLFRKKFLSNHKTLIKNFFNFEKLLQILFESLHWARAEWCGINKKLKEKQQLEEVAVDPMHECDIMEG